MKFLIASLITALSLSSLAAIKTETVLYKEGKTELEGFLAYDDSLKGKAPAVVIIHDWMGLGDYAKKRAQQMAEMGYVAFAADIYGKGNRPADAKQAGEFAGKFKGDRKLLRARAQAAYDVLKKNPKVDTNKMLAMGYCFGGTTAIEMALAGLPLKGIVSFHGGLDFPTTLGDMKNVKAKMLIAHGAIDPYVPAEQVQSFKTALDQNKIDYEFVMYSGAVHAFTQPEAGNDPSKGAAYHAAADKRSFEDMKDFFTELTQ